MLKNKKGFRFIFCLVYESFAYWTGLNRLLLWKMWASQPELWVPIIVFWCTLTFCVAFRNEILSSEMEIKFCLHMKTDKCWISDKMYALHKEIQAVRTKSQQYARPGTSSITFPPAYFIPLFWPCLIFRMLSTCYFNST